MKRFLLLLIFIFPSFSFAAPMQREVLAIYSSKDTARITDNILHAALEMPFNYEGIKVRYHDIEQGLPGDDALRGSVGVVSWFSGGVGVPDPVSYLAWAEKLVDAGKKFIFLGEPGFISSSNGEATDLKKVNSFLNRLGLEYGGDWIQVIHLYKITGFNPKFMGFERKPSQLAVPFYGIRVVGEDVNSLLTVRGGVSKADEITLAAISKRGGFVSRDYELYRSSDEKNENLRFREWYLNPFAFIEAIFGLSSTPKPDVTTRFGRRIYFSHVDGDGWMNVADLPEYKKRKAYASEVILEEIIKPYADLPVTVGAIGAEIDTDWEATEKSISVAREIYALPQVEAGSHTFSHPFYWQFFANKDWRNEEKFLKSYRTKSWDIELSLAERWQRAKAYFSFSRGNDNLGDMADASDIPAGYRTPRAYARKPFDLNLEVQGSINAIDRLLPEGKHVKVYQWSGNAQPFEAAVAAVEAAGIPHINGGNARFDEKFASYAWMFPIGREVGKYWQIYAPNSNENVYTGLWSKAFHGFQYVTQTFERSDAPYRIRPINVYYHFYSGEKLASLNALKKVFEYVRKNPIHPMFASDYARMAQGFFSAEIEEVLPDIWEIKNRGTLQTIRLDHAALKDVDYEKSYGVIGHKHFNGSLYLSLDSAVSVPRVGFKNITKCCASNFPGIYVLDESSLDVSHVAMNGSVLSGKLSGFGKLEMSWRVPHSGNYKLRVILEGESNSWFEVVAKSGIDGMARFSHEMFGAIPEGLRFEITSF